MSESNPSGWKRRCGFTFLIFSATLWCIVTVFFIGVWDQVAAITTFPQWSWALAGILSAMVAWRLFGRRARLPRVLILLWIVAMLAFADNLVPVIRGVVHGFKPTSSATSTGLRVVTLNCASSSA